MALMRSTATARVSGLLYRMRLHGNTVEESPEAEEEHLEGVKVISCCVVAHGTEGGLDKGCRWCCCCLSKRQLSSVDSTSTHAPRLYVMPPPASAHPWSVIVSSMKI
jgi:hypothetical protein